MHEHIHSHNICHIHKRENYNCRSSLTSQRQNFYKISFVTKGRGLLFYADQCLEIKPKDILFLSPNIPYAWHAETKEQTGYFLTFDAELLSNNRQKNLLNSTCFSNNTSPVYSCSAKVHSLLAFFFEQLLSEQNKKENNSLNAIQNYVELIIFQGMMLMPNIDAQKLALTKQSSSTLLSVKFLELLAQQYHGNNNHFTPQDYANKLSIHVNHLNRLLKQTTGKTTQQHVVERRMLEAKSLLRQSNKRISEIAYNLGFNHPSSFNHFFHQHQSTSPKLFRQLQDSTGLFF